MKKIILFILLLSSCQEVERKFTRVEKGQIWRFYMSKDNPFEPIAYFEYTVLDVKDGYVQYIDQNQKISSASISWFKIGAKKIK